MCASIAIQRYSATARQVKVSCIGRAVVKGDVSAVGNRVALHVQRGGGEVELMRPVTRDTDGICSAVKKAGVGVTDLKSWRCRCA